MTKKLATFEIPEMGIAVQILTLSGCLSLPYGV